MLSREQAGQSHAASIGAGSSRNLALRIFALPASVNSHPTADDQGPELRPSLLAFGLSFQEMEKRLLEEALQKASANVTEASRLLKMTRNTLRYRMAKHHLQSPWPQ